MFDGRDPVYLQIADQIRQDVLTGALQPEEQVMSTTQYATTFRINPATAAKAFAQLVDEGVLYKRRGVGMFVTEGAREQLLGERRESFFTDTVDPVADAAHVLGIDVEDVVARLRRRASAAGAPTLGEEAAR
ncbi:GntR family transcriptional regulator [Cellulomonas oligotrophica]|uniref:DNA-binding transcriptional regulator YhcF (GntR family) n=1 Tax=Cellulomonas oligotrophica TaxID=931536 RepID=A0A7Y9JXV9_9CELL|nr:GntR family transcriptional regulator [Cellulomonas oligotrophica]NYD86057.1 DNA-binding transcriptional regulator YhcF (GntR family) [Cellulomonas oligotrophica]GIG30936.1 GntR family transcriptional regulator [Cellulomonas oligotrophica]